MTMVQPDTPLTDVLKLLLDAGVSAVPVVDDKARKERLRGICFAVHT